MEQVLLKNSDVSAWSTVDMLGISPIIITHTLNVSLDSRPIRQKKRKFASDKFQAIKEEIEKLLIAWFSREVKYPN